MAIDRNPVAFARQELRAAGVAAVAAVKAAKPRWSRDVIAAKACGGPGSRTALQRLIADADEPGPSAQFCDDLDELCVRLGVGPFQLAELRKEWQEQKRNARYPTEEPHHGRVRVGLPPEPALALQPREEKLAGLLGDADAEDVGPRTTRFVLHGPPGVGKTQLARTVWDTVPGRHVAVWVNASARNTVVATYAAAAVQVEVVPADHGDDDAAAAAFLAWLDQTWMRWLVVVDNANEDRSAMTGLLPPQRDNGLLVVTSIRQDITLVGAEHIDVGVFTPDEAHDYLTERFTLTRDADPNVGDGATDLTRELGFLPVALAQAASYIGRQAQTCRTYLDAFRDERNTIDTLFPGIDAADSYAKTVATTWTIAMEAANRLDPVGLAQPAMELAAFLDPAGSPDTIWTSTAGSLFLEHHRAGAATASAGGSPNPAEDARRALRNLRLFGLITHQPTYGGAYLVRMHSLVQRVTREQLDHAGGYDSATRGVADAMVEIWPTHSPGAELLGCASTLFSLHRVEALYQVDIHLLYFLYSMSVADAGQLSQASSLLETVQRAAVPTLGRDHPHILGIRNSLAIWRGRAGDAAGAAAALEMLVVDHIRVSGEDGPGALAARNNLATWRGEAGDAVGAVAAFEDLLTDRRRVLGADHQETLATRNNLTKWRWRAGDAAGDAVGAVAASEVLLADQIRVLGAGHPNTLATRNNLAAFRGEAGDASGAAAALEDLLTDRLRVLGADHPDTLTARNNLAVSRGRAGDASGAAAAFEDLLTDRLRVLGADHPDTLATRGNLATFRGEAGDASGAAAAFEDLLTDRLRVLGADHPNTFATRHDLARWCGEAGHASDAAAAFEDLLTHQVRLLGADHRDTLTTRSSLALLDSSAAGALAALEVLLADQVRVLGSDHLDTLTTRGRLAMFCGEAGDAAGAVAALEVLLTDQVRVFGADHLDTLATRNNLARFCDKAGDAAGAVAALEVLLTDQVRVFGADHPNTLIIRENLTESRGKLA